MKMNLHKSTQNEELAYQSNETSDYEVKSDTLDQLYREQLTELRDLIFKRAETNDDIKICRKWLKVFNRTTKDEKMARNCLCTLMQQQIKENNCLGEPFTNLQNCNRDLESVLRELDVGDTSYNLSNVSYPSDSNETFKSHCLNVPENIDANQCEPVQSYAADTMLYEFQYNEQKTENIKLRSELESLRLQLTEKHIENMRLQEISEKYRLEKEENEEILDDIKKTILNGVREKLLKLQQYGLLLINPINIFETIFQYFANDIEFMEILRKYDIDFQHILTEHYKRNFHKQKNILARHICRKFVRSKLKISEKYERRLLMQSMAQKLQIKLAKLECFSILRHVFISSNSEFGKIDLWQVLKVLEENYQSIVNDDIKKQG